MREAGSFKSAARRPCRRAPRLALQVEGTLALRVAPRDQPTSRRFEVEAHLVVRERFGLVSGIRADDCRLTWLVDQRFMVLTDGPQSPQLAA